MEFRHKLRGWVVKTPNENVQDEYIRNPDLWEEVKPKKGKKKK